VHDRRRAVLLGFAPNLLPAPDVELGPDVAHLALAELEHGLFAFVGKRRRPTVQTPLLVK
jgi:hypothetical protein